MTLSLLVLGAARVGSLLGTEAADLPLPLPMMVGIAFAVCLSIAVWMHHHAQRIKGREKQVRSAAQALDLDYHGEDVRGFGRIKFEIYEDAEFVNVSHQVSGRTRGGTPICAFDFSGARDIVVEEASHRGVGFDVGLADESLSRTRRVSTGTFATVAVAEVTAYFPKLLVSPQGAMRRVVNNVTGADIKFESIDFNRFFQVTSENEGFARLFLNPEVIDTLNTAEGQIGLETFGRSVVLFGSEVTGSQLPALARLVGQIVERLDPIVIREYPPPDLVVPGEFRRPFLS